MRSSLSPPLSTSARGQSRIFPGTKWRWVRHGARQGRNPRLARGANARRKCARRSRGDEDICWGGRRWTFQSPAQQLWFERCLARGFTVPTWPTRIWRRRAFAATRPRFSTRRCARIGARPPLTSFGISMLGPALLAFGTAEQKAEHLPHIARGEIRWCQGYSEPGAGSDLASLRTRAEDKGDHFLVNGQKIWTSYADKADWIFCLVRTNRDAEEAARHLVPADRHGDAGRLDQADRADLRQVAVLRDLLRRCRGAEVATSSASSTAAGTSPNIC